MSARRGAARAFSMALCALVSVALGSCSRATNAPGGGNPKTIPHVLRMSIAEDIGTLNQVLSQQGAVAWLSQMTMAWLFRYDRDNRPIPELATEVPTKRNGDISADGRTIRIKLRHGVTWSDGAPFTADDVVFSTNVMNNPENQVLGRTGFELVTKTDEPDRYTVVFHLKRPFGPFLPVFFTTGGQEPCILPKHILGGLKNINSAPYNSLPIGIGPFKYAAWNRGSDVQLVRNPRYWRGQPKLERVIFKIVPDRNTAFAQMQTGELDLWYLVPGSFAVRLRDVPGVRISTPPSYLFNEYVLNTARPALHDVAVRRALRLAIDRVTILAKLGRGIGSLQDSFVPPTYPGAPAGIGFTAFDIARANRELDAAGWKRGSDGIRAKNGVRLALAFASTRGSPDVDVQIELVRSWWAQIGVSFTVSRYLPSEVFDPVSGVLAKGRFDVALISWSTEAVDNLGNWFACNQIPPNGQNDGRYCDSALTSTFAAFLETNDPAVQARLLAKLDRALVAAVPAIVTSFRRDTYAYNTDLKGFAPNAVSAFDDMMNVDI